MLEKEYLYYKDHLDELNSKFANRYIVIKDEILIGDYETIEQAMTAGLKQFEPGTFLVKQCIPEDDQIMRFYSRVSFSSNVKYI